MKLNRLKTILAAIVSMFFMPSCDDLRDDYEDCGVWLEFIFDYNMEYADSFDQQVGKVDVLVFDEAGKLYSRRYATVDELLGRKRMFLGGEGMPVGKYSIVTVGGLTEYFELSTINGGELLPGITAIEDVRHMLLHEEYVAHEFPHLWFGRAVEIEYKANLSVWQIPLMRQTNKFNITLQRDITTANTRAEEAGASLYTFEIITPESGQYDYRNRPLTSEPLSHRPYSLASSVQPLDDGDGVKIMTEGKLNTMRLLSDYEGGDYMLSVRNTETGEVLWSNELLSLLAASKPATRADETPLPLDEYFDREGTWNIVIVHNGTPNSGFIVTQIIVNNWIVWQTVVDM